MINEETLEEYFLGKMKEVLLFDNAAQAIRFMEKYFEAKLQQERMYSEESECVNMYLDDLNIPRKSEDGQEYSIVGRIKQLEKKYLKQMSDVESHYLSKKECIVNYLYTYNKKQMKID